VKHWEASLDSCCWHGGLATALLVLMAEGMLRDTCIVQMWSPQYRRDIDLLECIQRRATEMIQGMEHLTYEGWLRELRIFSLKKRKLQGDRIAAIQYLNGS